MTHKPLTKPDDTQDSTDQTDDSTYSEVSISSRSLINIGSWDFLEIIKVEYILRVEIEEMSRLNKSRDYNKCRESEINSIH